MKYEIRSNVENGILKRNRNLLIDAIKSFEGQQVFVTIQKAKKKRSNPQNSFYWGCVIPIIQSALKKVGELMTLEQTHELLRLRFLKHTVLQNEETGECVERIKSTTELSTTDFMDYLKQIQIFAVEYFGVEIPEPNENITLKFND
jgi:hypothetical protein